MAEGQATIYNPQTGEVAMHIDAQRPKIDRVIKKFMQEVVDKNGDNPIAVCCPKTGEVRRWVLHPDKNAGSTSYAEALLLTGKWRFATPDEIKKSDALDAASLKQAEKEKEANNPVSIADRIASAMAEDRQEFMKQMALLLAPQKKS